MNIFSQLSHGIYYDYISFIEQLFIFPGVNNCHDFLNRLLFYVPINDLALSSLPEVKIVPQYIHTCQVVHLFYLYSSTSASRTPLSPHLIFQFGGNRDEVRGRHSEAEYIYHSGIREKRKHFSSLFIMSSKYPLILF